MSVYARHGTWVRAVYLLIAVLWWVGSQVAGLLRGRRCGVVVLCYHGITDGQRRRFAWQMARLADRAIDAADVEAAARSGERRLRVCVTFDDAFANLLHNALPVMQAAGGAGDGLRRRRQSWRAAQVADASGTPGG